jgi:rhodanese-related sulfurtransferase
MIRSKFILWLPVCLILMFAASFAGAEGVIVISKDQLKAELAKPDVIVVDVRGPHDWESSQWKIKGARREPPAELGRWIDKYPKDKTIVFYCA